MRTGAFPLAGRPGHAGYTPQPVADLLADARVLGVLSSTPVRAAIALARPIASQAFPRLQAPERESTVNTMLRVQRFSQLVEQRRFPFAFREGFRQGTAPESVID